MGRLFFCQSASRAGIALGINREGTILAKVMLTGTMRCEPHEVDSVVALLPRHHRLSEAEPGCLSFELWQDELDPCCFHVSEVFRSEVDFAAHQDRTHSSDWGRVTKHMARDFNKRVL